MYACVCRDTVSRGAGGSGAGLLSALRATPASALVAAVCFFSVWSVLGLAGFHTYLASTEQTTNEDVSIFTLRYSLIEANERYLISFMLRSQIKGSFSKGGGRSSNNPYSRGNVCSNCWNILCGPVAPSLIDRLVSHLQ